MVQYVAWELTSANKQTDLASALQTLLEPFCLALARTKRPALMARLQDGVFGTLLGSAEEDSGEGNSALHNFDMERLATRLFDLGTSLPHPHPHS